MSSSEKQIRNDRVLLDLNADQMYDPRSRVAVRAAISTS